MTANMVSGFTLVYLLMAIVVTLLLNGVFKRAEKSEDIEARNLLAVVEKSAEAANLTRFGYATMCGLIWPYLLYLVSQSMRRSRR